MTQVSAASGALTWLIIEALIYRKATSLGFVSGILGNWCSYKAHFARADLLSCHRDRKEWGTIHNVQIPVHAG